MNRIRRIGRVILTLVILILGVIFTLLNPGFVALNLGFKEFSVPLVLLILLVFAFGLLLGLMLGYSRAFFLARKKEREEVALKLKV